MSNSKTSPHTRTSTSSAALIADTSEDLIKRTGIQMLALMHFMGVFTRVPAFRQFVQQIAPDAAELFSSLQASDDAAVDTPATLAERIDFVKKALLETRPEESISLRAFVHLIADDLRAAHPRLSWGEIAEILKKAGFANATADAVRQALKSAPPVPAIVPTPHQPPESEVPIPPTGSVPPSTGPATMPYERDEVPPAVDGRDSVPRQQDGASAPTINPQPDVGPRSVLELDQHMARYGFRPAAAPLLPPGRPIEPPARALQPSPSPPRPTDAAMRSDRPSEHLTPIEPGSMNPPPRPDLDRRPDAFSPDGGEPDAFDGWEHVPKL